MVYHISGGKWPKELGDPVTYIEIIEGDTDKIRLVDASQDDGTMITQRGWTVGRPMVPDGIPTKVSRGGASLKQKPLLDVENFYGQPLVTAAVKDLVEELEPGVHQFFPMELYVG